MTTPSILTLAREAERAAHAAATQAHVTAERKLAAAAAATKHREQVEKEEQERWVPLDAPVRNVRVMREASGRWRWRIDKCPPEEHAHWLTDDIVLALASLLPRKPGDTKLIRSLRFDANMIRSIRNSGRAVDMASLVGTESVLREAAAALEAVASDLTAPVAVAAPSLGTPDKGWLVMNRHGYMRRFDSLDDARQYAKGLDLAAFGDAPHVVYALHRVPDTETPPND